MNETKCSRILITTHQSFCRFLNFLRMLQLHGLEMACVLSHFLRRRFTAPACLFVSSEAAS